MLSIVSPESPNAAVDVKAAIDEINEAFGELQGLECSLLKVAVKVGSLLNTLASKLGKDQFAKDVRYKDPEKEKETGYTPNIRFSKQKASQWRMIARYYDAMLKDESFDDTVTGAYHLAKKYQAETPTKRGKRRRKGQPAIEGIQAALVTRNTALPATPHSIPLVQVPPLELQVVDETVRIKMYVQAYIDPGLIARLRERKLAIQPTINLVAKDGKVVGVLTDCTGSAVKELAK